MKLFLIILFIILFSGFSFAQFTIDDFRENYCKKDTFIAEIKLINVPDREILPKDFSLNCGENIEISPFLVKGNNYFVYFDLPNLNKECKLKLKLPYATGTRTELVESSLLFNIDDCYGISYKPGVFKLGLEKYNKIYVKNNNANTSSFDIYSGDLSSSKTGLEIPFSETRTFYVYGSKFDKSIYEILIGNYSVFALYNIAEEPANESVNEEIILGSFGFDGLKQASVNIDFDEGYEGTLNVLNTFNFSLHEVVFTVSNSIKDLVELEKDRYSFIDENEKINLNFYINQDGDYKPGSYSGNIMVSTKEGYSDEFNLFIDVNDKEAIEEGSAPIEESSDVGNITEEFITFDETNETEEEQEIIQERMSAMSWIWLALVLFVIIFVVYKLFNKKKKGATLTEYAASLKKK
ncbi:MAG: hypothetical protein PHT54_02020 [Candidatus Nanoarchaeia archaeon]|nr:hypothetical protein [Candidatus Nanoarchaeia archaeon]